MNDLARRKLQNHGISPSLRGKRYRNRRAIWNTDYAYSYPQANNVESIISSGIALIGVRASCENHQPRFGARPPNSKNSRANLEQLFGRSGPTSRRSIFPNALGVRNARRNSTSMASASLRRAALVSSSRKCSIEFAAPHRSAA